MSRVHNTQTQEADASKGHQSEDARESATRACLSHSHTHSHLSFEDILMKGWDLDGFSAHNFYFQVDVIANKLWCAGIAYEIGRRERQRKIKDEEERPSVVAPASFLVGYALTTSLKLVASLFSLFRGFGADFDMSYICLSRESRNHVLRAPFSIWCGPFAFG